MKIADALMIAAVIAGPILAVQAQKAIERWTERRSSKRAIFATLMSTRGTRLSPEHVRALNMIDLAFYGTIRFGRRRQTTNERAVTNAWKEYLDYLSQDESAITIDTREDLFVKLLEAIAKSLSLEFDRVHLKRNVYSPVAHHQLEMEQRQLRKSVLEIAEGKKALRVDAIVKNQ